VQEWEYRVVSVSVTDGGIWIDDTGARGILVDPLTREPPKHDQSFHIRATMLGALLGELGREGWEMMTATSEASDHLFFFKRPKAP